jgi:hypothetical protein
LEPRSCLAAVQTQAGSLVTTVSVSVESPSPDDEAIRTK